mmetsp:Transcript_7741/g.11994  ORF Transcript_7741/g.11994 Transcript_7741/m.11994 type:complete len:190 (+) Transcript_7741:42-611(+)
MGVDCENLIEFSKYHTFKVAVMSLVLCFLANLGRYDFNVAIAFVSLIFYEHIMMHYTRLLLFILTVSCSLDVVWLSLEGPITHHYHDIKYLRALMDFSYVFSIFNLVTKITLIVCVAVNPHPGHYASYRTSNNQSKDFSVEPYNEPYPIEEDERYEDVQQPQIIDYEDEKDNIVLEATHGHSDHELPVR